MSILGVGRGEWRTLRPTSGVSGPHRLRRTLGQELSNRNSRTGTLEQELSFSLSLFSPCRNSPRPPVCSAGLRPVAPPRSLLHLPSRRFEIALERGRSSSLTASHRAYTNRERAAPPLPLLTKRVGIQAGDSGGRNSGKRFRREKFGREMSGGRPPPRLPQEPSVHNPASLTRPAEIVAARCM